MVVKEKWKAGHLPNFPRSRTNQKTKEDFIKMLNLSKLFIARTLLCATIIALSAQGQHAMSSRASFALSAGGSAITCQPGLVFRCSKLGCFCVRP